MRFLLLLLLLVVLVPVVLVRAGLYFRWLGSQYQAAVDANRELSRATASTFSAYINDVARQGRSMGTALTYLESPISPQFSRFLVSNAKQYAPVRAFHWVNLQGRVINSSEPKHMGLDVSWRPHFLRALASDNWIIADLVPSIVDGVPIFMVDRAIRDETGQPLGVVAAIVDPLVLEREIFGIVREPVGSVMILDRQRRIVCSNPPIHLAWEQRMLPDDQAIQKAMAGILTTDIVRSPLNGQRLAVAYASIGNTGWLVMASRPVNEILAPLRHDILWTGTAFLIVLSLSGTLALLVSRQINRGVKGLQEHAAALSQGRLDHRAEPTGISELQAVVEAFNQTAASRQQAEQTLKDLNETLERRVAERTAEAEHRATQLRAMAAELSQTEERERRRLAQMLHDDLQQLLAATKFHAGALQRRLDSDALRQQLAEVIDLLDQSIKISRSLTIELSPPILYDAGLPAALNWLARWMQSKHGLLVEVNSDEAANPEAEEVKIFLFQSARELLFNVAKHAQTNQAWVALTRREDGQVELVVRDKGNGFDLSHQRGLTRSGFGLFSIHERIELLGGHIEIQSTPGVGTQITLLAPSHVPAANDTESR